MAHGYQAKNFALGGVLVAQLLPAVLFGPIAGVVADRFNRRHTMVFCDVVRFGLFLSIPLLQSLTWLFAASFLIECFSTFWRPAKEASVPNLLQRKDQLESANQLFLITTYGITPVGAAALFAVFAWMSRELAVTVPFFRAHNLDLALYFNAATFVIAAVIVAAIRRIDGPRGRVDRAEPASVLALLRDGFAFIGRTRLIRGLCIGVVGAFAATGAVIGTGKVYAASLGGGDASYGFLFGAIFLGLGAGMALGPRVARDLSRRRLFGVSIIFAGCALIGVAVVPHIVYAVVGVFAVGFGGGVAYLSGMTLLGGEVDDAVRGRTFAFVQSMVQVVLIGVLAAVPFLVGVVRKQRFSVGGAYIVIDGTRFLLTAAGLVGIVAGVVAVRLMDDRPAVPLLADLVSALRGDTTTRRRLARGGMFIAFEGGEGSGKSTQARLLAEWLDARGVPATVTHEPGATPLGERVRDILLRQDGDAPSPRSEALLFAADRAHHVDTVIRPALDAGQVVISDRYVDSSLAYQGGGRAFPVDEIRRLSAWATRGLRPDLTILLDVDPAVGLGRARGRSAADRLEQESVDFHRRVRKAFTSLAEHSADRYLVIDARAPVDAIAGQVRTAVAALLADRGVALREPADRPEHVEST